MKGLAGERRKTRAWKLSGMRTLGPVLTEHFAPRLKDAVPP